MYPTTPINPISTLSTDWAFLLAVRSGFLLGVRVDLRLDTDPRTEPVMALTPQHNASVTEICTAATDPPVWVSPQGRPPAVGGLR